MSRTHIDTQQHGVQKVSTCCPIHGKSRGNTSTCQAHTTSSSLLGSNRYKRSTHIAAIGRTPSTSTRRSSTSISLHSGRIRSVHSSDNQQNTSINPWKLLEEFTRADFRQSTSPYLATRDSRQTLRDAFFYATTHRNDDINWNPETSPVLLGILSSDVRLAIRSLRDYTGAMNVDFVLPEVHTTTTTNDTSNSVASMRGPVYIRYRKQQETIQCTIAPYTGNDRGVLVQFGNQQVGHLPLGLIDEDMKTSFD